MIDKSRWTCASAVADIPDGATVMVGGFGTAGMHDELIDALIEHGARGLTIITNNAGHGDAGLAALIASKRVRKVVCSFPWQRVAECRVWQDGVDTCRSRLLRYILKK